MVSEQVFAQFPQITELEKVNFTLIIQFLKTNPDFFSSRKKGCSLETEEGLVSLLGTYLRAKNNKLTLKATSTVPDEAVSIVLQACHHYTSEQTERIKVEHQQSMAAENIVGALLERYIAQILEPYGWVWCAGDFVRAIDFIKYDSTNKIWKTVQVKNRDNTENSSSSAIRTGTEIEKWFRTFSRTGATNWAAFPEEEFRSQLSEEGFRDFIKKYLSS